MMQTMTAKQAQAHFGRFSREAQRETILVTNHGQPSFLAMPVRITYEVAKIISETSPRTGEEAGRIMKKLLKELGESRPKNPDFTEDEINALIKSADD